MKVMTFNMRADTIFDIGNRWKYRAEIVYDMIQKYDCDIIGIQEATNRMVRDIRTHLTGYSIVGEGRTKKIFAESNNILVPSRHEILSTNTFWLSKTPQKEGSTVWYSLFPRICTTALVKISKDIIIRVYNTHLDCLLPHARDYGLRKIGEYMEKCHSEEKYPAILMGDFNATPNSRLIHNFSNGLYSSKKFIAVQDSNKEIYSKATMGMFKGYKKGLHIDYIFVSEEFDIQNVEIGYYHKEKKYPSDHYPIIADIDLKI